MLDDGRGKARVADSLQLSHVDVDLDGLAEFTALLGRERAVNLMPSAHNIGQDHSDGVRFGYRNPGDRVQSVRTRYQESMSAAAENLSSYIEAAGVLIEAMKQVEAQYRHVDALSVANSLAINASFTQVITDIETKRVTAMAAAQTRGLEAKLRFIE